MSVILYEAGDSHLRSLIQSGKYDAKADWTWDASDQDALLGGADGSNWGRYGSVHLGEDTGEAANTRERYKYPGAKADGDGEKVFRSGLVAAKQRAGQQGNRDIEAAAGKLIDMIDEKDGKQETKPADDKPAEDKPAQDKPKDTMPEGDEDDTAAKGASALAELPRIAARVFGSPLMIAPAKLDAILGVLGPRFGLDKLPRTTEVGAASTPPIVKAFFDDEDMSADDGDACPYDMTADGMALISISGTLVYKSSWLSALSGMTSYAEVDGALSAALADPAVKGILLCIDSNGGECSGCFDLSDKIHASRAAKPVYAVAADTAYSAAYAIAAAADKLFVSRTSGVGSIGVVALHVDVSEQDKMVGEKFTYIYSGDHKVDGNPHEPLSDTARASLQAECDEIRAMFVASVAKYRGLAADKVAGTEASTYLGAGAVGAGLADQLGTPADALTALRAEVAKRAGAPIEVGRLPGADAPKTPLALHAPAAPETPKTAEVIDLAKVRGEGAAEATAKAIEITEMCALAGAPDLTASLLAQGKSLAEVRQTLQARRAAVSRAHAPSAHILPNTDPTDQTAAAAGWEKAIRAVTRGKLKE